MVRTQFRTQTALVALLGAACSGGGPVESVEAPTARPVTTMRLEERDFTRETRLTGSVSVYREEQVGFEVDGRLLAVLDVGREAEGPVLDEEGRVLRPGEVIARLDDARYRFQARALEARRDALLKELEAGRIDVDRVAQSALRAARARHEAAEQAIEASVHEVESAEAGVRLTTQTLERRQSALERNAISPQEVDEAQSAYDRAIADKAGADAALLASRRFFDAQEAVVATAEAAIEYKRAQLEATDARLAEIAEELKRAQRDLEDCSLLAPFGGRITQLHASQGAVIEAGMPVATLTLLDPIQVRVAVSADEDRHIRFGDRALLFPKDPIDPDGERATVYGLVYEKGAVADPLTRTFRIDLMTRNERRRIEQADPETRGLPVVTDLLPVVRRYRSEDGPLFIAPACILEEGGRTYVLRLPGVSFHEGSERSASGTHIPEKIEVELAADYFTVVKWTFRALADGGALREGDFLVVGPLASHANGLAIGRPQWLLRPGDLVPVQFLHRSTPKGFYVPIDAIIRLADGHAVFTVDGDRARLTPVSVHEDLGELRRIESERLEAGLRIVVRGVHYLSDGEPVSVVEEERLPR